MTLRIIFLLGFLNIFAVADNFKMIKTAELKSMMADKKSELFVFDANNNQVREKNGIVKGAKTLADYKKYNVAKTLPANKAANLVFYCYNEQCMASHKAAERAASNKYQNVFVLSDGIVGWKAQGGAVEGFKP